MENLSKFIITGLELGPVSAIIVKTLLILTVAAVVFGFGMGVAGILTFAERRVAGRMQSRIGPNRVGPLGLFQFMADGLKLLMKEDVIPDAVDRHLFKVAPTLVMVGVFTAFAVVPFGPTLIAADLNVGLLFMLAMTSLVTLGVLMSGWASNNKWSMIGGIRAAAQIVSYELPSALAVLSVVLFTGTLSMQSIIGAQGGWPWEWHVFHNPFLFVSFFLYYIAALAEGNRTPFDLPEAESELVSGYNTEYSGMRFAAFFMAEFANIYLMSAITVTLYFGGWRIPFVSVESQASSVFLQLLGMGVFVCKSFLSCLVVIWLRWTLPRLRVDQMMSVCYRYLIPLGFLCLTGNAVYMLIIPDGSVADMGSIVITFAFGMAVFGIFFWRVFYHIKAAGVSINLDILDRGEKGAYHPDTQVRPYGKFRKIYDKRIA